MCGFQALNMLAVEYLKGVRFLVCANSAKQGSVWISKARDAPCLV